MKRLLLLASTVWLVCLAAVAAPDFDCVGMVVDEQNEPMAGATVKAVGSNAACATDIDGMFKLNVPATCKTLKITFVGYKSVEVAAKADVGTVVMTSDSNMLEDVVVTQSVGRTRLTPVAMSTVTAEQLEFKLGNQELLEVLKTTPGVYTRSEGGG